MIEARRKVLRALDAWFESLPEFLPADALQEAPCTDASPEKELLRLPSDFDEEARHRLGLIPLSRIEFQLRCGQLHDALNKLRNALGLKSFLVRCKYHLASGQGALLRSETEIERAGRQVQKWIEVYKRGWCALNALNTDQGVLSKDHPSLQLQELHDTDCIILSEWLDEHRFWREQGEMAEGAAADKGRGRRELPWFWKIQFESPVDEDGEVGDAVKDWANDGELLM